MCSTNPLVLLKRPAAILLLILLWGFGLRVYHLVDNPPAFLPMKRRLATMRIPS